MYHKDLSEIRITVDYLEDFKYASVMMKSLVEKHGLNFTWHHVVRTAKKVL